MADSSPACVEAAAITRRVPTIDFQLAQRCWIGGRSGHVELEIAAAADARRAELCVTLRVGVRLRQAQIEAAEQRRDHARQAAPAAEGALRYPAVDQDHRNAAAGAGHNEIGPQVGFDKQRQIGLPVIEKAADKSRRVERNELVHAPAGRRCSASAAEVTVPEVTSTAKFMRADALDQRNDREHFADAGAMQPDQRAGRARQLGDAIALGYRAGFSLPRLRRHASNRDATAGAAAIDARR